MEVLEGKFRSVQTLHHVIDLMQLILLPQWRWARNFAEP